VIDHAGLRPAHPQRVVEVRDRDVVFAFVEIGRAAQIVDRNVRLEPERLGGVGDHLGVVALLVPADRAPEIRGRQIPAGEHLQGDDLVAGVDLLVGRRGVGGAERPELLFLLGNAGGRPQHGGERGQHQDRSAHELVLKIRALRHLFGDEIGCGGSSGQGRESHLSSLGKWW
jgi:hypothetical protein